MTATDDRCATCHRSAHRPGMENYGVHGHAYKAPAGRTAGTVPERDGRPVLSGPEYRELLRQQGLTDREISARLRDSGSRRRSR